MYIICIVSMWRLYHSIMYIKTDKHTVTYSYITNKCKVTNVFNEGVARVENMLLLCTYELCDDVTYLPSKIKSNYCHQWSTGIEILSRPGPGRDDTHPGRDRDRDRDRNEIPAGTGISFIPAGTGTGTGIFPLIFTIC